MNHFEQIGAVLPEYGLDALLVTSEPGEFYTVGFHGEGVALVTPDKTWYYTDSRYIEAAGQQVAGAETAMPEPGKGYHAAIQALVERLGIRRLGFEDEYLSVKEFNGWKECLDVEFVPASELLIRLRAVKDQEELAAMRQAQRITDEAFAEILKVIQPGRKEREIAARLTYIMTCKGAQGNSFDPIVAAGPNGSKPHAVPGDTVIENGMFVTMDFGCKFAGYCSDMTRTVAVGRPSEEMVRVYDTVLRAQLAGISRVKAGVPGSEVHRAADEVITAAGYGGCFGHGFGHSLGIEIHENPRFSPAWEKPVPAGAVLSAEPGIYLPGKFGVRIEDVVVVREDGWEDITASPKELIILS